MKTLTLAQQTPKVEVFICNGLVEGIDAFGAPVHVKVTEYDENYFAEGIDPDDEDCHYIEHCDCILVPK